MNAAALIALLTTLALGMASTVQASILPPNDLHLEDNLFSEDANMTEEEFSQIIDDVAAHYTSTITSHGATLDMKKNWGDSTVNAFANQTGSTWVVSMFGGLARRPEVTKDGFALVVCHELGHHLGGFPLYAGRGSWAASEGQSDYFATQACARKIWAADLAKNAESRSTVHPTAKAACDAAWSSEADQNLCYRTAMGGQSLAALLAALRNNTVDFDRPDTSQVSRTQTNHPKGQCRLDTYLAGALCGTAFDQSIIPGKNHPDGQGSLGAETAAAKYSCTRAAFQSQSSRPLCWYKPRIQSLLLAKNPQAKELRGNRNKVLEPGETVAFSFDLENLATKAYRNVKATISSSNEKVEILKGEHLYTSIDPQSSKAPKKPFEFKLAHMTCGESFDITVNLDLGEGRSAKVLTHKLKTGKEVTSEKLSSSEAVEIPDNNPSGVTSAINVAKNDFVSSAVVTVDITHTYSGDLSLHLLSPTGEEIAIQSRKGGGSDDIKKSFNIEFPTSLAASGDWQLKIADHSRRDTGTLNSWDLQFKKAVCEPALKKKKSKKKTRKKRSKKKKKSGYRCEGHGFGTYEWLQCYGAI